MTTLIKSGKTIIPTAGTIVQLSTTQPTPNAKVTICAGKNNVGNVYYGDKTISAANQIGAYLPPGASVVSEINDLSKIWLDVENSNDLVTFTYEA